MEYVFYKIVCNDLDVKYTYVGSTTNFTRRKCQHKGNSNDEKYGHMKLYKIINENGGFANWTMVKIETCICASTLDARKRERYFYEELNANMNMIRPMSTLEENKENKAEWNKQYGMDNKESIAAYKKDYYEKNKDKQASRVSDKIHCEACDCYNSRGHISRDNKSPKHLANINKLPTIP